MRKILLFVALCSPLYFGQLLVDEGGIAFTPQILFPIIAGGASGPAITIVNQTTCNTGANTTHNCTIPAPASGNILIALGGTASLFASFINNSGLVETNVTWTNIVNEQVQLANAQIFCGDVSGSASGTVAVTRSGSTGNGYITFVEVHGTKSCSNINGFLAGGSSGITGNGGSNTTVGTATKTPNAYGSPAICFATFGQTHGNGTLVSGLTGGFLALSTPSSSLAPSYLYIPLVKNTDSYQTNWTLNSADTWDSAMSCISH